MQPIEKVLARHSAVLALIAFIFFAWNATSPSFWRGDESVYVLAVQDTARTGNLWYPTWVSDGVQYPFWMKPPLRIWLGVASTSMFGESNLTHRLPDILAGFGILVLTFTLGYQLLRGLTGAYYAVIALLSSSSFLFLHGPRQVSLDPLLVALQIGTLLAGWNILVAETAARRLRWSVIGGVVAGAAMMTKSVAALIPFGLVLITALLVPTRFATLAATWRYAVLSLLIALGIGLPYFVFHCSFTFGACFPLVYEDIFLRSTQGYINSTDYLLYLRELFAARSLVPPETLVVALLFAGYRLRSNDRNALTFLLVWGLVPLVVFSLMPSRLLWYSYLSLPALAILQGYLLQSLTLSYQKTRAVPLLLGIVLCVVAVVVPATTNVMRIAEGASRLPIDLFIEDLLSSYPQDSLASYDLQFSHPRSESIYPAMLRERFRIYTDLRSIPENVRFVATTADRVPKLLTHMTISSYLRLPPTDGRKRWIVLVDRFGPSTLRGFQSVEGAYDLTADHDKLLFGWSDIGEQGGVRYRRLRGPQAALEVLGDYLLATAGATLELAIAGDPHDRIMLSINGQTLTQTPQEVTEGFKTVSIDIPKGVLIAGRHQLLIQRDQKRAPLKVSFLRWRMKQK